MQGTGVIITCENNVGLELHTKSSPNYIEAYLRYCSLKGCVSPEKDGSGWASLCQVISNYLGGTEDVVIDRPEKLDVYNFDNGVYFVKDWSVDKHELSGCTEDGDPSCLELLYEINNAQPSAMRLDPSVIDIQFTQASGQVTEADERRRLAIEALRQSQADYEAMQDDGMSVSRSLV